MNNLNPLYENTVGKATKGTIDVAKKTLKKSPFTKIALGASPIPSPMPSPMMWIRGAKGEIKFVPFKPRR